MPVLSKGFEIETEMNIHALDKNFVIKTVEVDYRDRPAGSESKLNTVSDGVRVIKTIVQLFKDYRPLLFFSTLAALLAVGAIGHTCFYRLFPYRVRRADADIDHGRIFKAGGIAQLVLRIYFRYRKQKSAAKF